MIIFSAAVLAAALLLTGQAQGESGPELKDSAETLAEIPEDARLIPESVSARPASKNIAYVYAEKQGFRVCMNTECSSRVDRVARDMPVISEDGKNWAAVVQKDGKARVILNGDTSRGYDMVHSLEFSPDSMKMAYVSQEEKEEGQTFRVHVNRDTHDPYALINTRQGLVFSQDSERLAYAASPDGETWHLVENGEPGPEFAQIKHITFSPDSERLAYAAKKDGKWHMVEDGDTGPGYRDIKDMTFCPESEDLAYVAGTGDRELVVKNGEESQRYDQVTGELVFSQGGERLAYSVAEKAGGGVKMRAVIDGEPGPAYEKVGAYRFSPDGEKFAYMAEKDGKGRMVVEGEEHPEFDSVGIPVFGPESENLAYMALEEGSWFIRKNGENGPEFKEVENPVFSPEGERMAHIAKKGNLTLVVEGEKIHGAYNWVGTISFTPDGKHLVYTASKQGESFIAVEGKEGEERFLSFLKGAPLVFVEKNAVHAVGLRDRGSSFWLLQAEIID